MHTFAGHNQIIRHSYANKQFQISLNGGTMRTLVSRLYGKGLISGSRRKNCRWIFWLYNILQLHSWFNYGLNYQVVFELYAENPLSEDKDGNIIKTKEEPVYRGATDKKGIFNDFISIPSYLTELTFIQTILELSARFSYKLQTEKYLLIRKLLYKVREMRRVRVEGLPIAATNIRKVSRF